MLLTITYEGQNTQELGYLQNSRAVYFHPEGRKAIFLGDLCDRGNRNADVLRIVMNMVKSGSALAVPGNHDKKLLKYLKGQRVSMTHGIDKTISEIESKGPKDGSGGAHKIEK